MSREEVANDEAMAKALQEEYNQETRDLRGRQPSSGRAPDYREAGYQNQNGGSVPTVCQVSCSMCRQINQIPWATGVVDFRCSQCGFLNSYAPPMANGGYGGGCRAVPIPIFCNIM